MVNPPESLSFPLGVGTFKPGKAKSTRLESPVCVGAQKRLDFRLASLFDSLALRDHLGFDGLNIPP